MFNRNERGKLTFDRLNFDMMMGQIFESAKPKSAREVRWIVKKMFEEMQYCAEEYCDEAAFCDVWEDLCALVG